MMLPVNKEQEDDQETEAEPLTAFKPKVSVEAPMHDASAMSA